jgi:hypothetical protein
MKGPFYKMAAAKTALEPSQRIWAKQINATGSCAYYPATSDAFIDFYIKLNNNPSFFEVIPYETDLKLYFDIEFSPETYPNLSIDDCVAKLTQAVQQLVEIDDIVPFQLDSSAPTKSSRHLIYPVVVSNMAQMSCCAHHLKSILGDIGHTIDVSVYSPGRLFRLAYASKFGQKRPLLPYPYASKTRQIFVDTMVGYGLEGLPRFTFNADLALPTKKPRIECSEPHWDRLLSFLDSSQPVNVHFTSTESFSCGLKIDCIKKGLPHRSNHVFCNVTLRNGVASAFFVCSDPSCNKARWRVHFDVNVIMFPDRFLPWFV